MIDTLFTVTYLLCVYVLTVLVLLTCHSHIYRFLGVDRV